ncbi:MAG: protein-glutamate O-methyltransferase CheR [Magnetovibrio sp.]|nr:protein-glutamate O-methyltransferase CheR [Magnetovibrio sp.]
MPSGYFDFIRDFLKEHSGLVVTPDKMYLLETRLNPLARKLGYSSIDEMIGVLQNNPNDPIGIDVSEAMNTHESLFFRDNAPFELFKTTLLPELLKRRADKRKFRVWCAACSSGQEPYSLAMVLDELSGKLGGWRPEIVATDISKSVLQRAANGLYSQFEVQRGLPVQLLVKYFTQKDENWRLNDNIRNMITFREFNLLDDPKVLGTFDIIMCRNVLIYFDIATKSRVLGSISRVLADDGVLFLGSAESTMGLTEEFWPVKAGRGVYKHTNGPASIAEP